MKKLYSFVFTIALVAFGVNSFAAEQGTETTEHAAGNGFVVVEDGVKDILCDFRCPISSGKEIVRCFEVDNCRLVTEERAKALAREIAADACERLQKCCEENGCYEFKCELAKYEWCCASIHRLCIRVTVIYKCQ